MILTSTSHGILRESGQARVKGELCESGQAEEAEGEG